MISFKKITYLTLSRRLKEISFTQDRSMTLTLISGVSCLSQMLEPNYSGSALNSSED